MTALPLRVACPHCGRTVDTSREVIARCLCGHSFGFGWCPGCGTVTTNTNKDIWRCQGPCPDMRARQCPDCYAFADPDGDGWWRCQTGHRFVGLDCRNCGAWVNVLAGSEVGICEFCQQPRNVHL